MTFLVAFDDSPLSRGALRKAAELGRATDSAVVAVSVIPGSVGYAREKGWLKPSSDGRVARKEAMRESVIEKRLAQRVTRIAPGAGFDPVRTDREGVGDSGVGPELRRAIRDHGATDVFVGSSDAGATVERLIDRRDTAFHLYLIRRPYIPDSGLAGYS